METSRIPGLRSFNFLRFSLGLRVLCTGPSISHWVAVAVRSIASHCIVSQPISSSPDIFVASLSFVKGRSIELTCGFAVTSGAAQSSCGTLSASYTITHADLSLPLRSMSWPTYPSHRTSSHLTAAIPGIFVASLSFAKGRFLALTCGFAVTSGYLLFSSVLWICSPRTPVPTSRCHHFAIDHIPISHLISSPGVFAASLSPSQRDVSSNFVDSADIWTTLIHLNTYDFIQDFGIVYCIFVSYLTIFLQAQSTVMSSTQPRCPPVSSLPFSLRRDIPLNGLRGLDGYLWTPNT